MKLFFYNLIKYREYSWYSAIALLREEVTGSFLNWLWWILDPLLFMMVYSFVALIVFGKGEPFFVPFVFIGYGMWQYFNRDITSSVRLVWSNKKVLSRVYLPKYILLFARMFKNFIQMMITLALGVIIGVFMHVPFTWRVLYIPYILLVSSIVVFGICTIVLHIGVYLADMRNIINILLRLVFYFSGVFYSIPNKVPAPWNRIVLYLNPAGLVINEMRKVMLYKSDPDLLMLTIWAFLGAMLSALGVHLIHKYEKNYVKAV